MRKAGDSKKEAGSAEEEKSHSDSISSTDLEDDSLDSDDLQKIVGIRQSYSHYQDELSATNRSAISRRCAPLLSSMEPTKLGTIARLPPDCTHHARAQRKDNGACGRTSTSFAPPPPALMREENVESSTNVAHRHPHHRPGAYPLGGGGGSSDSFDDLSDAGEVSTTRRDNEEAASNRNLPTGGIRHANNDGLAVANLVTEEQAAPDLPHAAEVSTSAFQHRLQQRRKQQEDSIKLFKTVLLFSAIGLVALIMVLLAVLVSKSHHKNPTGAAEQAADSQSQSPSQAPTTIEDFILALKPDIIDIDDTEAPQSRAFRWLLEDADYLHSHDVSQERIQQRYALATLYFSTQGDSWTNHQGWLNHSMHECDWETRPDIASTTSIRKIYPQVLSEFQHPATKCNHDNGGLYEHLWLDRMNLQGSLPEELFVHLTSLKSLSLGLNQLKGTLSTHIGLLTNLEALLTFRCFDDKLGAGTIPTEIGLLTKLTSLALSDHFQGSIPFQIWTQLTGLYSLLISENVGLEGSIPTEIGLFSNLQWLDFDDCQSITGTIPTEIGLLEQLVWFAAHDNQLSGTVPSEIGLLTNLNAFMMSQNSFTGRLPSELGLLTSMSVLKTSSNHFFGAIPSEFGLLFSSLTVGMDVHNNQLSGTIPTELSNLVLTNKFYLQENQLTGPIPSEFGLLSAAGIIDLSNNSLSGTVPQALSGLHQSLYTLNLEGNPLLSGVMPESLCSLDGTCMAHSFLPCEGTHGLFLDCSTSGATGLCGCHCSCT